MIIDTFQIIEMIEVFLFGIVLGLIPITFAGLFITTYLNTGVVISWAFD